MIFFVQKLGVEWVTELGGRIEESAGPTVTHLIAGSTATKDYAVIAFIPLVSI